MRTELDFWLAALAGLFVWCALAAAVWQPAVWLVPIITAWLLAVLCPEAVKARAVRLGLLNAVLAFLTLNVNLYESLLSADVVTLSKVAPFLGTHVWPLTILAGLAGAIMPCFSGRSWMKSRKTVMAVLFVTAALYIAQAATLNPVYFMAVTRDSGLSRVGTDSAIYRQIYRRVCSGDPVYDAISVVVSVAGPVQASPTFVGGYRMPGIFMLWKYLSFGCPFMLMILFLLFTLLSMWSVFSAGEAFLSPPRALVSALLIGPVFFYGTVSWLMLMTEYWAIFFVIFSLPFLSRGRLAPAVLMLSLAAFLREFMLASAALLILAALLDKRLQPKWMSAVPLAAGAVCFALHVYNLCVNYRELITDGLSYPVKEASGWPVVLNMMQYAEPFYAGWVWVMPLMFIVAAASAFRIPRALNAVLGGTALIFVTFSFFNARMSSFYWGIIPIVSVLIMGGWITAFMAGDPEFADASGRPDCHEDAE